MNPHEMTIKEVKEFLLTCKSLTEEAQALFAADVRSGVQTAYKQWHRRMEKAQQLHQRWLDMSTHEQELWEKGYAHIAGVDEVGRGPLAGPVVTAAVILSPDFYLPGLDDSKKVPAARREEMYEQIMGQAVAVSVSLSDAALIDEINIFQATLRAMQTAVQNLSIVPDITLNDAVTIPQLSVEQRPIIGGDGKSISIAAASIIAKVERDRMMKEYDTQYPGYGFASNMGYGTAEHLAALRVQGPCRIHRRSFGGVLVP
ncbi:ribonuclease HII [Aneurinibacillus aneurinilyticus]|uniref:ribonuclease HII n=1 Tax=Aneurinibacillus aneurinilyticus TaxID=1391 RepID=UPI002E1F59F5|nr:ribonuclease HII [Aneurinibacillus aneurinilyticus]MED0669298.1 ribonuclease HII [Aneurinibacillus aneurinilyticus]